MSWFSRTNITSLTGQFTDQLSSFTRDVLTEEEDEGMIEVTGLHTPPPPPLFLSLSSPFPIFKYKRMFCFPIFSIQSYFYVVKC